MLSMFHFSNSLSFMGHFLQKKSSDGQRLYFKTFVPTRSHLFHLSTLGC